MNRFVIVATAMAALLVMPVHARDGASTTALQVPVVGTGAGGETFSGTFTLQKFATDTNNKVVAVGTVAGMATDASGKILGTGLQTVAIPVAVNSAGAEATAVPGQVTASCSVLHVDLGPMKLTLLGAQANLGRAVMDFTAIPGSGNEMSNLLCGAANGSNDPAALAQLLNQVVSALQGV